AYELETVDRGHAVATGEARGLPSRTGGLSHRAGGFPRAAAGPSSRAAGGACGGAGEGAAEPHDVPRGSRLGGGYRGAGGATRAAARRAEAPAAGKEVRERLAADGGRESGATGAL